MLWTVHHPDGTRSDPLMTEQLIGGLKQGTISGYAWVQRDDDPEWRPIGSYEAFHDFCDPDAPKDPPPLHTRVKFALACGSVLFAFVVGAIAF